MKALLILLLVSTPSFLSAQELPMVRTHVEVGFLDPLSHTIQFGSSGTQIDYVDEGGQDVLFPFFRAAIDATFSDRHRITFLYQPLNLESNVVLTRDWLIDDLTFPEGTAVNVKYGFPFYRLSYGYDLAPWSDETDVMIGASLQLRNATIFFTSADGSLRRGERDVGPVPILRFSFRQDFFNSFAEFEIDGFYAPIKYINGGSSDVVGAIIDTSIRYGYSLGNTEAFLNLRYLGGGAEGTSDETDFGDGFTRNWLHFATVSLGFSYYL